MQARKVWKRNVTEPIVVTHRVTVIHDDTVLDDGRVIPGEIYILHLTDAELALYRQPEGARVRVMLLADLKEAVR